MQFWAFLANPSIYDVERAVRELHTDDWLTDGKPIRPGDRAIVWKAKGRDDRRGVVALAEVLSEPFVAADTANPYWRRSTELAGPRERVRIRYERFPELPMWATPDAEFLNELSVACARGGTVFYVTGEQWHEISSRLSRPDSSYSDSAMEAVIRPTAHIGQAFLSDAAARRAIELRAMTVAREYYETTWIVQDVSADASYDLHCRAEDCEL